MVWFREILKKYHKDDNTPAAEYVQEHSAERSISPEFDTAIQHLAPVFQEFARDAVFSLEQVLQKLSAAQTLSPELLRAVKEGIIKWLHEDSKEVKHGVGHSYYVYSAAVELQNTEITLGNEEYKAVKDSDLKLYAILHDLAEFLPRVNEAGEILSSTQENPLDTSKDHTTAMRDIVLMYGHELGISLQEAKQIAFAIAHHDDSFKRPTPAKIDSIRKRLSLAAQLFYDADRFGGAAELKDMVSSAIRRNRQYSRGSWTFFQDLSVDIRLAWQVRTKGYFDGLSALLSEFLGFEPYMAMTQAGKHLVEQRKQQFDVELIAFYRKEYEEGLSLMGSWDAWRKAGADQAGGLADGPVFEIGIKGGAPDNKISQDQMIAVKSLEFHEAMAYLTTLEVNGKKEASYEAQVEDVDEGVEEINFGGENKPKKSITRKYVGYSIKVGDTWYDPSILRFQSADELEQAFKEAIKEYTVVLLKRKTEAK